MSKKEMSRKIGYRTRTGERVATEWHEDSTVTVTTFGLNGLAHRQTVTYEAFENAVLNHGMVAIGEDRDPEA